MMNSLVSSLTTFTDNISDNLNSITSLISNSVIENPVIRIFKTESSEKEDCNEHQGQKDESNHRENLDENRPKIEHEVETKNVNSEETMRKGYSEDVPDANPDYQPAYDTQEQPWPWSMNQR